MHARYSECTWTPAAALAAPPPADPAPLRARISTARITPIRRRNAPRRLVASSRGRQTARVWTGVGHTSKEGGISTQSGPYDALTCLSASARERGFVGRRAQEQRTCRIGARVARQRLLPTRWHQRRMPCASASPLRSPAGRKAAESSNGRGSMGREGGRTGRTHLMVGATGLSMAETFTVAAMHNAVEKTAKKSVQLSPAEQQQQGRELERRRGRAKWEFGAIQARGAALRTSIQPHQDDGSTSCEPRAARDRLAGSPRCVAAAKGPKPKLFCATLKSH